MTNNTNKTQSPEVQAYIISNYKKENRKNIVIAVLLTIIATYVFTIFTTIHFNGTFNSIDERITNIQRTVETLKSQSQK